MIINLNLEKLNIPLSITQIGFLSIWQFKSRLEAFNIIYKASNLDRSIYIQELEKLTDLGYVTLDNEDNLVLILNRSKVELELFGITPSPIGGKLDEWEEFFNIFPKSASNIKNGTKRVLSPAKINSKTSLECKAKYLKIVKNNPRLHRHIINCLVNEAEYRTKTHTLQYMSHIKTQINSKKWEEWESILENELLDKDSNYGQEIQL